MSFSKKTSINKKKKSLHATEVESKKNQSKRVEYWQALKAISPENLVFIDEKGINLAMVRTYARSQKGKRAYGNRPDKRGKNITLTTYAGKAEGRGLRSEGRKITFKT